MGTLSLPAALPEAPILGFVRVQDLAIRNEQEVGDAEK